MTFFKCIFINANIWISNTVPLKYIHANVIKYTSTFARVVTWCCQATSHNLIKCWPSLGHNDLWVNFTALELSTRIYDARTDPKCNRCIKTTMSSFNSSGAFMRQEIASLVKIVACRLIGVSALFHWMLPRRHLDPSQHKSAHIIGSFDHFICGKYINMRNFDQYVKGTMS